MVDTSGQKFDRKAKPFALLLLNQVRDSEFWYLPPLALFGLALFGLAAFPAPGSAATRSARAAIPRSVRVHESDGRSRFPYQINHPIARSRTIYSSIGGRADPTCFLPV